MDATLFWLSNAENEDEIFAYGIELSDDDVIEAVTFRRDPRTQRTTFGTHDSAEAALARYGRLFPVALHYEGC